MSSSNRSPRSSNTSSSSSSHSSSSHSSHSPRSSHSSRKSSNEGRSERREEGVTTSIQGNLNQGVTTTQKAEVFVQTKESWDMEAIQELEKKIAVEQAALIDAQKLVNDQTTLFNEAQQTKEDKLRSAQKLETFVSQKSTDRDRLLQEEKQLELQRAAAHAKAVEAESARTELLAQAVLAKEEAKVSESLSLQRKEGINQAQALVDAHRLAIQKLEEHRSELKRKDVNVSVRGEALPQPKAVDINVAVKPLDLPEARVTSNAVSTGAGAQSHIHEALPTHEKTVLPAREVNAAEAHAQKSTVERHVVQNVSNVTNITTQSKRDQNIS